MWGRVRQTLQAISAWSRPVDDTLAASYLSPALLALYRQMSRSDRQHHLRVLRHLLADGHTEPALLVAALLHDVGKTRARFGVFDRILATVVKKIAPQYFAEWGKGEPRGWRRPFVISAQHPAWGAEMLVAAGAEPLAVALTRLHQDDLSQLHELPLKTLLGYLQAADDAS